MKKNKYTSYVLVTVAYVILTMFVVGDEPINVAGRFLIVYIWIIFMLITYVVAAW